MIEYEKIEVTKEEIEKGERNSSINGALTVGIPALLFGIHSIFSMNDTLNLLSYHRNKSQEYTSKYFKVQSKNDSLNGILDNNDFYLQTKEGNFVSYETAMQQEKAKLDSVYQVKQDSLKKVYESKLEKISLEN